MSQRPRSLRRSVLPLAVFLGVLLAHSVWLSVFPERDLAQERWAPMPAPSASFWLPRYIETQGYWLGLSYALSLAFAAAALRRYREEHLYAARTLALGGVTLSGSLAVAGCYLLGCCGSPMLAVYLNLLGATFLPLARPLVATLTALTLLAAWRWMDCQSRSEPRAQTAAGTRGEARCRCD